MHVPSLSSGCDIAPFFVRHTPLTRPGRIQYVYLPNEDCGRPNLSVSVFEVLSRVGVHDLGKNVEKCFETARWFDRPKSSFGDSD
jgi:hypothetical protein